MKSEVLAIIARSGALFQTHHVLCMFSVVVILTFWGYTRLLGERLDTKTGCPWWEVFAELPVPHFPCFTLVRTEYLDLTWGLGLGVGYCRPGLESQLCLLLHQSPWANQLPFRPPFPYLYYVAGTSLCFFSFLSSITQLMSLQYQLCAGVCTRLRGPVGIMQMWTFPPGNCKPPQGRARMHRNVSAKLLVQRS